MVTATYKCDGCGRIKGDTNNWYAVDTQSRTTIHPTLTIRSFDDGGSDYEHYCSEGCLGKRISKFSDELRKSHDQLRMSREADDAVDDSDSEDDAGMICKGCQMPLMVCQC